MHWAEIEKPATGQVFRRATRDERIARGWLVEPRLRVLRFGSGPAPWDLPSQPASPAAPAAPAPEARAIAGQAGAPSAAPISTEDAVAAFEAAASAAPTPAVATIEKASMSPQGAEPDAVIDRALALLAESEDLRVRRHVVRLRLYLAEHRAGVRLARRDRASLQRPF